MQYNAYASQYNAMQCNAMQCTYVRKSVRPYEWSQSVIFFFFFFHFLKIRKKWQILLKPGFNSDLAKMEIWMYGRTLARFRTQTSRQNGNLNVRTDDVRSHLPSLNGNINKMSVCTNVTDGQTSFSYFSLVSVQSHSQVVRPSVRRSGKLTDNTDRQPDPIGGNTLMTDGTIQEQTCRTINITFKQQCM
jgi:hypothetical protein